MTTMSSARPREVNSWRAAAILYGDWGTSKAYVLGLAFALASYSSFWFIFAVSILTLLVGSSYIIICKLYPNGGGVYASAREHSKVLSVISAFFLLADYLVTAALSALAAFHYLDVAHPEYWAICSIGLIGILNFLGPKNTGSMAIALAIPTLIIVVCLGMLSLPFISEAIHNLPWPHKTIGEDWNIFVGIIVALSGIEAIANMTGSMKLDPGSTIRQPSVAKTSTPAIIMVMLEVCIFTSLFGLAMNALPGLEISGDDVNAPGFPNVRDAMLRYMGQIFSGSLFGPVVGTIFSFIISIVITLLLLSAVNTALVALISLLFIVSRDGELPEYFQKLNRFGVPIYPTLIAFLLPMGLLLFVSDVRGLANLYAVGFVGAIAVNLGATSINMKLIIKPWQRFFMFATFIIMTLIELSLFIDKPEARNFVFAIMTFGLFLRTFVIEGKEKKTIAETPARALLPEPPKDLSGGLLVAVQGINKALDYALDESEVYNVPLHILFIREQKVTTDKDNQSLWGDDQEACKVFDYVIARGNKNLISFLYTISSHVTHSLTEIAKEKNVKKVIIGRRKGPHFLLNFIRGTSPQSIFRHMPKEIDLIVIY
ncbi:MAG: universal stress protein [Parachlamydiaceae bacterium]|nr:universal stress protein [Parachlamydiaceae bacterium]